MALDKGDKTSDAIADLYRASYYLAKQSSKVGMVFLLKAKKKLGNTMLLDVSNISNNYLYWAEKVLDEYKRLKMNLSSNKLQSKM